MQLHFELESTFNQSDRKIRVNLTVTVLSQDASSFRRAPL